MGSVPLRRLLRRRAAVLRAPGLAAGAAVFGFSSGIATGTGVIQVSLLLSAGLTGPAVLATDALSTIVLDLCKAALFQRFDLLDAEAAATGAVIGLATLPGSALAAWLSTRIGARLHVLFMETLILLGGASMLWHAWRWALPNPGPGRPSPRRDAVSSRGGQRAGAADQRRGGREAGVLRKIRRLSRRARLYRAHVRLPRHWAIRLLQIEECQDARLGRARCRSRARFSGKEFSCQAHGDRPQLRRPVIRPHTRSRATRGGARRRLAERLLAPLARRPARPKVAAPARAAAPPFAPVRLLSRCRARPGREPPGRRRHRVGALVPGPRLPRRRAGRERAVRALQCTASPVLGGRRPVCAARGRRSAAGALSASPGGAHAGDAARAGRRADRPLRLFPRAVPRYLVARRRRLAGKALNENARGQDRRGHRGGERAGTRHGARLCRRRHACRARGRR